MDVIAVGDSERIMAIQDVVSLNAAAALVAYDALSGLGLQGALQDRILAKLPQVRDVLASDVVSQLLKKWITLSQGFMLRQ
jgi:hypothetical protein